MVKKTLQRILSIPYTNDKLFIIIHVTFDSDNLIEKS